VGESVVWVWMLGGKLDRRWHGGSERHVRVEVCDNGTLALGNGDEFVAGAFDDGEGDGFLRHCVSESAFVVLVL
jgi:hypothetical protein